MSSFSKSEEQIISLIQILLQDPGSVVITAKDGDLTLRFSQLAESDFYTITSGGKLEDRRPPILDQDIKTEEDAVTRAEDKLKHLKEHREKLGLIKFDREYLEEPVSEGLFVVPDQNVAGGLSMPKPEEEFHDIPPEEFDPHPDEVRRESVQRIMKAYGVTREELEEAYGEAFVKSKLDDPKVKLIKYVKVAFDKEEALAFAKKYLEDREDSDFTHGQTDVSPGRWGYRIASEYILEDILPYLYGDALD